MKTTQIKTAFDKLSQAFYCENINWADRLFEDCRAEEKEHRGFMSDFARSHTSDTVSVADCARLFAVKRVASYLLGEKFPSGKEYLHTQRSCFTAAGMVDEFRGKIVAAWANENVEELALLDYTDFVKVREEVAA